MAKFSGLVGYVKNIETKPGQFTEQTTTRKYYGDVIRNTRRLQSADKLNDNIVVSNEISIVADAFANENFYAIRFVEFMGARWKVSNAEVLRPRIILTLGEVYNGENR